MAGQLWTVALLEVRQMLGGLKLLIAGFLIAAIAMLAFVVRLMAITPPGAPPEAWWPFLYLTMLSFVFLQTVLILVPLLYATSLVRNEVDSGTLVYLVTRPIPKPLLLLAKFAAMAVASSLLIVVGMAAFHIAFLIPGGDPTDGSFGFHGRMLSFMLAGVLGVLGYGAVFTLVGLIFKRGLIWGIAYGFISEFVLTNIPAVVRKLTLMHYLRSVALSDLDATTFGQYSEKVEDAATNAFNLLDLSSPWSSCLTVLAVAASCMLLSCLIFANTEYVKGGGEQD